MRTVLPHPPAVTGLHTELLLASHLELFVVPVTVTQQVCQVGRGVPGTAAAHVSPAGHVHGEGAQCGP